MNTFELLKELSNKPKHEIEYVLTSLMLQNKIDFLTVNKAYVNSLESINEDKNNKLIEAESCILEHLMNNKKDKSYYQRSLYLLNQSNRFNMNDLNEKFHYNEEEGKKQSWYERNKEIVRY